MGAMIVGAAALVGVAAAAAGAQRQRSKLRVAGVDLSGVDLRRPFIINYSVGPHATLPAKVDAMRRLREASEEFNRAFPAWVCEPDAQLKDGSFVLKVTPFEHPAQQVSRRMLAP
jgi:hypothetical protein